GHQKEGHGQDGLQIERKNPRDTTSSGLRCSDKAETLCAPVVPDSTPIAPRRAEKIDASPSPNGKLHMGNDPRDHDCGPSDNLPDVCPGINKVANLSSPEPLLSTSVASIPVYGRHSAPFLNSPSDLPEYFNDEDCRTSYQENDSLLSTFAFIQRKNINVTATARVGPGMVICMGEEVADSHRVDFNKPTLLLEVVKRIGKGGSAEVFECVDLRTCVVDGGSTTTASGSRSNYSCNRDASQSGGIGSSGNGRDRETKASQLSATRYALKVVYARDARQMRSFAME
ncbi:unnamed protein product, partial [Amoebophrya sp. A120]